MSQPKRPRKDELYEGHYSEEDHYRDEDQAEASGGDGEFPLDEPSEPEFESHDQVSEPAMPCDNDPCMDPSIYVEEICANPEPAECIIPIEPELVFERLSELPEAQFPHTLPGPEEMQELPVFEPVFEPSRELGQEPDLDPALAPEPNHEWTDCCEPELRDDEQDIELIFRQYLVDENDKEFEIGDDDEDMKEEQVTGDQWIYPGAQITVHQSLVSILTLVLSFRLSGVCTKAILDLINLHLPKSNNFRTSLKFFKSYFLYLQGPKEFKYYCSVCYIELLPKTKCTCEGSKICYLVVLSVLQQLQTMLKRDGFYSQLDFSNDTHEEGVYKDVRDGDLYQELVKKGVLGKDGRLSFQWYTDGAALYESTKDSVWTFFLTINELPYNQRFKKENVLVPVLWCGPVKPPPNLMLNAVYPDLVSLKESVQLDVKDHGEKNISGLVMDGSGDMPARSLMLNMNQFNGENSCQACEQKGVSRKGYPGVRLFPYSPEEMTPRTLQSMEGYAKKGTDDQAFMGVKGPTTLSKVMPDFIKGTAIDPMHQLYGGVAKTVLKLLISTKAEASKWSLSQDIDRIDSRLLSIHPPAHVPRLPRALSNLGYFKMNELKSWLQDYSLPVLKGILPDRYLKHHGSLVAAARLLNADAVSKESTSTARLLLHQYISQFPDFYHPNFITMNFHLLLHLHEIVTSLGPLTEYSCFALENINGVILNLVHGTRWAEKQIASSVLACLGLSDLIYNLEDSASKDFCTKVINRHQCVSRLVVNGTMILGKCVKLNSLPSVISASSTFTTRNLHSVQSIRRGKYVYTSIEKSYLSRDSSVAVFNNQSKEDIGVIQVILYDKSCKCSESCHCEWDIHVVIQKMKIVSDFSTLISNVFVPGIHAVRITSDVVTVSADKLLGVCVKMEFDNQIFIAKPTNSKEIE